MSFVTWNSIVTPDTTNETVRANQIIVATPSSLFPLKYEGLKEIVKNYMVQGYPIEQLVTYTDLYQMLDLNFDGFITNVEFDQKLTPALIKIESEAIRMTNIMLFAQLNT